MISALWTLLDRLERLAPMLRVHEAIFASVCRRHLARLDRLEPARAQHHLLLGLVVRGRKTPFGRSHDFNRIRTLEDYRRLVPLSNNRVADHGRDRAVAAAHRRGLLTAFALLHANRPTFPLTAGRILSRVEQLPESHWPGILRPCLRAVAGPVCLIDCEESYPDSAVFLRTRRDLVSEPPPARASTVLDLLIRPEGIVALHDPRLGGLRLLVDHGLHYEFIRVAQRGERVATRLDLTQVEIGQRYEVAITAPGGWWATRSGLCVEFDRLDVPTFRVVPDPVEPPHSLPAEDTERNGKVMPAPHLLVASAWPVAQIDRG